MLRSIGSRLRPILAEPLVHFAILGIALFGLHRVVAASRSDGGPEQIVFSEQRVEHLARLYEADVGRIPDAEELQGIVEQAVRQEVLYREALSLGLDEGDPIVRRRLVQKMEFVLTEQAAANDGPDEATLREYYEAHKGEYEQAPRVSFSHVFFSKDRRKNPEQDATRALARLREPGAPDPFSLGDPFVEDRQVTSASRANLEAKFGLAFAETVSALAPERWVGPVQSSFGWHLVRLTGRTAARTAPLAQVRARVVEAWRRARAGEVVDRAYREARARYDIEIQWPRGAAQPAGGNP